MQIEIKFSNSFYIFNSQILESNSQILKFYLVENVNVSLYFTLNKNKINIEQYIK